MEAGLAFRAILLSDELTEDEVEDALLRTAATAPGEDLITTTVIKAGWAALKGLVGILYRVSLCMRYRLTSRKKKKKKARRFKWRVYSDIRHYWIRQKLQPTI